MIGDVLLLVSQLSCVFQSSSLDISIVDNLVSSTIENRPGASEWSDFFARKLDSDLYRIISNIGAPPPPNNSSSWGRY